MLAFFFTFGSLSDPMVVLGLISQMSRLRQGMRLVLNTDHRGWLKRSLLTILDLSGLNMMTPLKIVGGDFTWILPTRS